MAKAFPGSSALLAATLGASHFVGAPADEFPPKKPVERSVGLEPLLTAEEVAQRLNVSPDWVWDHSSRRKPLLPVIRMGDGTLRYRPSGIEAFVDEQERTSALRRRRA